MLHELTELRAVKLQETGQDKTDAYLAFTPAQVTIHQPFNPAGSHVSTWHFLNLIITLELSLKKEKTRLLSCFSQATTLYGCALYSNKSQGDRSICVLLCIDKGQDLTLTKRLPSNSNLMSNTMGPGAGLRPPMGTHGICHNAQLMFWWLEMGIAIVFGKLQDLLEEQGINTSSFWKAFGHLNARRITRACHCCLHSQLTTR